MWVYDKPNSITQSIGKPNRQKNCRLTNGGFLMENIINDSVNYEITIKFIDTIKKNISENVLTQDVSIVPRNEDFSQYIFEDDSNVLLSFSNK